jgi:hypothetical protein
VVPASAQADGQSTGASPQQLAANPIGYCYKEQPVWSAYRESSFGHGTLDVLNATHALWRWIRNQVRQPHIGQRGTGGLNKNPSLCFRDLP